LENDTHSSTQNQKQEDKSGGKYTGTEEKILKGYGGLRSFLGNSACINYARQTEHKGLPNINGNRREDTGMESKEEKGGKRGRRKPQEREGNKRGGVLNDHDRGGWKKV